MNSDKDFSLSGFAYLVNIGFVVTFLAICHVYIYLYPEYRIDIPLHSFFEKIPAISSPVKFLQDKNPERAEAIRNIYSAHWLFFCSFLIFYFPFLLIACRQMLKENPESEFTLTQRLHIRKIEKLASIFSNFSLALAFFLLWHAVNGMIVYKNYTYMDNAVHIRDRDLAYLALSMAGFLLFFGLGVLIKTKLKIANKLLSR